MNYYLINAYSKEVDEKYQTHLHPTYLTCYKMDGKQLGLQSGLYDALKFLSLEHAKKWMKRAEKMFPMKEFGIVPFPDRVFGRVTPKFVIADEFDPNFTFDVACASTKGFEKFVLELTEEERLAIIRFIRVYNANVPAQQGLNIKINGKQV